MTSRYSNNITDQNGTPLEDVTIYVYNQDESLATLYEDGGGALANPVTSDAYGNFYFNAADGLYSLTFHYGGLQILRDEAVQVGVGLPIPDSVLLALAQPTATSLVGFINSGASAQGRTLEAELREYVSAKANGATGNGVTNDAVKLASVMTQYPGREIRVPVATFINQTALSPAAKTVIRGEGKGAILKTNATGGASNHVILINTADVTVRNLAIQGAFGSDVHNNSGIGFDSASTRTLVENVELSGMGGSPLFATGGASHGRIMGAYVHNLSASYQNSAAIDLYSTVTAFTTAFNLLDGSDHNGEVGILNQTSSTRHKHIANRITGYKGYGILDYDIVPRSTYNLFLGNDIDGITGSILGSTAGMGVYLVSTGGQVVANNHITNCNVSTTTESLAPGAIGISEAFSPILSTANMLHHNNWYGLMVVASTQIVTSVGDVLVENTKDQLYVKATSNAQVVAASITALTVATGVRAINVNVNVAADVTGNMLVGIRSRGGGATARAWEIWRSSNMLITGNSHSDCAGTGLYLYGGAATFATGNVITSNIFDVSGGNNIPLTLNRMQYTGVDDLVLKTGGATALQIADTSTGVRVGKNIGIYASGAWQANPMNFIDNQGTGCIVEAYGSAAPTVLSHKVGDIVWNTAPAASGNIGWVCVTAGTPGTWKTFGAIAA